MKVHEIAKKYNVTSKDILAFLETKGISVKSHLSKLDDGQIKIVDSHFSVQAQPLGKSTKAERADVPPVKDKGAKVAKKKVATEAIAPKVIPAKPKVHVSTPPAPKSAPADEVIPLSIIDDGIDVLEDEVVNYVPPKRHDKSSFKKPKQENSHKIIVKKKEEPVAKAPVVRPEYIQIKMPISVSGLATKLVIKTSELIKALMGLGVLATVNQQLGEDIVMKMAEKFNVIVEKLPDEEEQLIRTHDKIDDDKDLEHRPPIVTMMGHVDHGKTSLLDAIRKSNVADREAGKITQHIGAYAVTLKDRGTIAFLDTPGHAAFTAMRARGAHLTDIVILVVAADDGVMPQTIEAIDHAKAAGTPIVVAINKADLPSANVDRVKAELQKHDLVAEDWGGTTIMCKVSALTGEGIDELLEMLLLQAEILELRANKNRAAQGTVVEGTLSRSLGVVATILVQNGTLHIGDTVVCGQYYGKVRAMRNDRGKNVKEAGPSTPVELLGLSGVPDSGERFYVVPDEKQARTITEKRLLELKEKNLSGGMKHLSLECLYDLMKEKGMKELKIILKADVHGSVEVLKQSLEKISSDKIKVNVIHSGVGGVNESDVVLAVASDAVIIGFHVKADSKAQSLIDRENVDMKYYKIIYEVINDVKLAMEGLLEPTIREKIVGTAEVKQTFKASKFGLIAGCMVRKGKLVRNYLMRLIRDNIVVYDGKLDSLKRFKDDAKEVAEGFECGIVLDKFSDLKPGDIIECYMEEKVATKL
jgi:translation initiation factor IF-2